MEENLLPADSHEEKEETPSIADFSCESSESFGYLLSKLGLTLMLTSYQANRLILINADDDELYISVKAFPRPMGLAVDKQRIVLGVHSQVFDFQRCDAVASSLEPMGLVKHCFSPSSSHFTGMINIHDIAWGDDGLWAVNSNFSCLCLIQSGNSFVPKWKPWFISELVPEDRCHLNGMALRDGAPAYVTCFNDSNENKNWRNRVAHRGLLIDVNHNEILADELYMPHSPRYYRDKLYFCNSGYGQLCSYDFTSGQVVVELELPGFTRGIGFHQNLMFVGLSQSRESKNNQPPPIAESETYCGIYVIDLDDMEIVANLHFSGDMVQIYDVAVIDLPFTEVLQVDEEMVSRVFNFPAM